MNRMNSVVGSSEYGLSVFHFLGNHACLRVEHAVSYVLYMCIICGSVRWLRFGASWFNCRSNFLYINLVSHSHRVSAFGGSKRKVQLYLSYE